MTKETMPKPEREREILRFFIEHQVMLTPKLLHMNLVQFEGATFSYRTVVRLLGEMEKRGLVERVGEQRSPYWITDDGREYALEKSDD